MKPPPFFGDGNFFTLLFFFICTFSFFLNHFNHLIIFPKSLITPYGATYISLFTQPIRRRDPDELSSSGYSSAINAEYFPVATETMDTGDYELYDPRIHAKPRIVQSPRKVRPEVVNPWIPSGDYSPPAAVQTWVVIIIWLHITANLCPIL